MNGLSSLHALDGAHGPRIWLATDATDRRCGFDRLAERVKVVMARTLLGMVYSSSARVVGTG